MPYIKIVATLAVNVARVLGFVLATPVRRALLRRVLVAPLARTSHHPSVAGMARPGGSVHHRRLGRVRPQSDQTRVARSGAIDAEEHVGEASERAFGSLAEHGNRCTREIW
jgi:hypothetical protein